MASWVCGPVKPKKFKAWKGGKSSETHDCLHTHCSDSCKVIVNLWLLIWECVFVNLYAFVLQPSSCAVQPTVWPAPLSGLLIYCTQSFCLMFFTCLCIPRRLTWDSYCKHSLRWVLSSRRRCGAEFKTSELKKACLIIHVAGHHCCALEEVYII